MVVTTLSVGLLHCPVDLPEAVRAEHDDEEGAPQDGEGEHALLILQLCPPLLFLLIDFFGQEINNSYKCIKCLMFFATL